MRRIIRHPSAVLGLVLVMIFLLLALFGPHLSSHEFDKINLRAAKQGPSAIHWLGTDELGRDMLTRILHGARVSLSTSVAAVAGALVVGTGLGLLSALGGRWWDELIMRLMDLLLALPGLLLAIFAVSILGFGLPQLAAAIAIYSVPTFARLARGTALAVKERDFVQSALAAGATPLRIAGRHVLPNILSPLIVQSTLRLATANLSIASLGFLGLGAQPPTPEWGLMVAAGRGHLTTSPHIALAPAGAILIVVLGFNLLGDGMRDLLDPRLRR